MSQSASASGSKSVASRVAIPLFAVGLFLPWFFLGWSDAAMVVLAIATVGLAVCKDFRGLIFCLTVASLLVSNTPIWKYKIPALDQFFTWLQPGPERVSAENVVEQAREVRHLREALTSYQHEFAKFHRWAEMEVSAHNAPFIILKGGWGWSQWFDASKPYPASEQYYSGKVWFEVKAQDQAELEEIKKLLPPEMVDGIEDVVPEGQPTHVRKEAKLDVEFIRIKDGDSENSLCWHWGPIQVNLGLTVKLPDFPEVLVPATQRDSQGRFARGWVYLSDVRFRKDVPLAKWESRPTDPTIVDGMLVEIARYVVVLERGQKSDVLAYVPPVWQLNEKGRYERRGEVRSNLNATFKSTINGRTLVNPFGEGQPVGYQQHTEGTMVVQVELGTDSTQSPVAIEFVYFRKRL